MFLTNLINLINSFWLIVNITQAYLKNKTVKHILNLFTLRTMLFFKNLTSNNKKIILAVYFIVFTLYHIIPIHIILVTKKTKKKIFLFFSLLKD